MRESRPHYQAVVQRRTDSNVCTQMLCRMDSSEEKTRGAGLGQLIKQTLSAHIQTCLVNTRLCE